LLRDSTTPPEAWQGDRLRVRQFMYADLLSSKLKLLETQGFPEGVQAEEGALTFTVFLTLNMGSS
jgi:hypothetical protein